MLDPLAADSCPLHLTHPLISLRLHLSSASCTIPQLLCTHKHAHMLTLNGIFNGIADGMCNGIADGMCNSIADGMCNGIADSMCNGIADGMFHGIADSMFNDQIVYEFVYEFDRLRVCTHILTHA